MSNDWWRSLSDTPEGLSRLFYAVRVEEVNESAREARERSSHFRKEAYRARSGGCTAKANRRASVFVSSHNDLRSKSCSHNQSER